MPARMRSRPARKRSSTDKEIELHDGMVNEVWNYNWDQAGLAEFASVPI